MNLLYNTKITPGLLGLSTGAASTGREIDMSGFEGCLFILHGTSLMENSAGATLKAAGSTASGGTFVAYSQTAASTHIQATASFDRKMITLDVYKPLKRYVKCLVTGNSSDTKIPFTVTAIQYGGRYGGSTNYRDSTYIAQASVCLGATSS